MTLDQLREMISQFDGCWGDMEVRAFDEDGRLRQIDINFEIGGVDSKDKYSMVGTPCLVGYGITAP